MQTATDITDHYETLQISKNADSDTVQRVFRLLAQRYHPDNQETGNEEQFRQIHDSYLVLNDPEKRAKYDVRYDMFRQERWKFVANGSPDENDFSLEQHTRFVVLEILYSRRRTEPARPALSQRELVELIGRPREHLEFTIWYLSQRKMVARDDQSSLIITADGVDFVEQNSLVKHNRLRLVEHR